MDNPEKLATSGTQDEDKQNKDTTQYVLDTTIHKQTIELYFKHLSKTHLSQIDNIIGCEAMGNEIVLPIILLATVYNT